MPEKKTSYFCVTVEFVPDYTGDPDAYRTHRETKYVVDATTDNVAAIHNFEGALRKLHQMSVK